MTEQNPREFWIREPTESRKGSCIVATEVKPPWEAQAPQASSHWLRKPAFKVIEKSAFDSVVKDLAEQIKVNLAGQERELKIMHEVEKLRAENERLKDSINSDFFAEVIMEWKSFWMNQTQNSEEDRKNYFNRAFGVDANMKYDLANRIVKALRGADEP